MREPPVQRNPTPPPEEKHGCEHCLCCACERTCTRCHNCSPMNSRYIPLIGCNDFIDMRKLEPLRYIYFADRSVEYKLHLKLP
ncbi:MAG: hypothetical protein ABIK65_08080 [Candidatus Eisenbacteria bacterium]